LSVELFLSGDFLEIYDRQLEDTLNKHKKEAIQKEQTCYDPDEKDWHTWHIEFMGAGQPMWEPVNECKRQVSDWKRRFDADCGCLPELRDAQRGLNTALGNVKLQLEEAVKGSDERWQILDITGGRCEFQ
jgi:hypothetical protein